MKEQIFKILVGITTHDRLQWLKDIVCHLQNDQCRYDFDIYIVNDFPDGAADLQAINGVKIYNNERNYGRNGYWRTINKILEETKSGGYNYLFFLPDDVTLCKGFVNKSMQSMEYAVGHYSNIGIVNLIRDHRSYIKGPFTRDWTDGCSLFNEAGLRAINYCIDPIGQGAFTGNPDIHSHVWPQVTRKTVAASLTTFTPEYSYTWHRGHTDSRMHVNLRRRMPLYTKNFIDEINDL